MTCRHLLLGEGAGCSILLPGIELSTTHQFIVIKEQGPEESLWDTPASNPPAPGASPAQVAAATILPPTAIDDAIFQASRSRAEDIAMVRNQGLDIDDDNEPVPENIPSPDAPLPAGHGL